MEILSFLKDFRSKVASLRSSVATLEKQLELARRRREDLKILPPTKAEVVEILCGWVRAEAEKYPTTLRHCLDKLQRDRDPVTGLPRYGCAGIVPDILIFADTGRHHEVTEIQSTLAFFLKDVLCAGIERAVGEMSWRAGPPLAERVAELDRLDRLDRADDPGEDPQDTPLGA